MLGWRLRHAGFHVVRRFFDTANAFSSLAFESMDEALIEDAMGTWNRFELTDVDLATSIDIIRSQYWYASTYIEGSNGAVSLEPTCGIFTGSGTACNIFNQTYAKPLQSWVDSVDKEMPWLVANSPIDNVPVSLHTSGYVDDIAHTTAHLDELQACRLDKRHADLLGQCLGTIGVAFNDDKAVKQLWAGGVGAHAAYKRFYGSGSTRGRPIVPTDINTDKAHASKLARYLGPVLHFSASFSHECGIRVRKLKNAYFLMGSFWYRNIDFRIKIIVFKALVLATAVSGVVAFVLSTKQYTDLETAIAILVRKLLRGAATRQTVLDDGTTQYSGYTRREVLGFVGIAPIHVELAVARLR